MTAADAYRRALAMGGTTLREPESSLAAPTGELEWQARWFAGEFGREWQTVEGLPVRIEDFGRWNHEAGPDFIEARVRIGADERRGAIELDLDARDWEHHGHSTNPAFRETILHVFARQPGPRFFTRTCDHCEVPQILLDPAAPPARPPALPEDLLAHDEARARAILHAAARHRLDAKAAALRHYASVHGEDDAWFAALAVALGYKHNRTPFLLLAQRVGLRAAAEPGGRALLFGVAGFLETPQPPNADPATRAWLRNLWEDWWTVRARCARWILPPDSWHFAGLRPANHPHRRVASLAAIAAKWPSIRSALADSRRAALMAALESLTHSYWSHRFNLQAAPLNRPQALLGAERIRDILLNIHHPLAVSRNEAAWPDFLREAGPAPAAIMRAAANRFFGNVLQDSLDRAVIQQGLLQIERDHRAAPDPAAFLHALRTASFPNAGDCPPPHPVQQ